MEINFSGLASQKCETAQQILVSLNELSAAYASDTKRASTLCKEK